MHGQQNIKIVQFVSHVPKCILLMMAEASYLGSIIVLFNPYPANVEKMVSS